MSLRKVTKGYLGYFNHVGRTNAREILNNFYTEQQRKNTELIRNIGFTLKKLETRNLIKQTNIQIYQDGQSFNNYEITPEGLDYFERNLAEQAWYWLIKNDYNNLKWFISLIAAPLVSFLLGYLLGNNCD